MKFRSERKGAQPYTPRVISIVLALTGLAYGLEGLFFGSPTGQAQADFGVSVALVVLCSAHLVWTVARIRRRKEFERELELEQEQEPEPQPEPEQATP